MITAQQLLDWWWIGAKTANPKITRPLLDHQDGLTYGGKAGMLEMEKNVNDAIARGDNAKQVVPRMIHRIFWETYYQWADGLEKVLKSEQLGDVADIRLATEYREACERLDIVAANYAITPGPDSAWTVVAKQAAIPARK